MHSARRHSAAAVATAMAGHKLRSLVMDTQPLSLQDSGQRWRGAAAGKVVQMLHRVSAA